MFIAAVFTTDKRWKQSKCPSTEEWVEMMWSSHTMEYSSAVKWNKFESVIVRWMNLKPLTQNEVRKRKSSIVY